MFIAQLRVYLGPSLKCKTNYNRLRQTKVHLIQYYLGTAIIWALQWLGVFCFPPPASGPCNHIRRFGFNCGSMLMHIVRHFWVVKIRHYLLNVQLHYRHWEQRFFLEVC